MVSVYTVHAIIHLRTRIVYDQISAYYFVLNFVTIRDKKIKYRQQLPERENRKLKKIEIQNLQTQCSEQYTLQLHIKLKIGKTNITLNTNALNKISYIALSTICISCWLLPAAVLSLS